MTVLISPLAAERTTHLPEMAGPKGVSRMRRVSVERALAFVLPLVALVPASCILLLHYKSIFGDASAREANAYYVFFSNDPHLAAIGFVWNPLTSVAEMPLILLKNLWPALTANMMAAGLMSCIFMAGGCYQLYRILEDFGVGRVLRWILTIAFIADPMIFFYGSNGMSEALLTFLLLGATRSLAAWLKIDSTRSLVASGMWIGLAYAARNEAAMAAFFASLVVLGVSYRRSSGSTTRRRMQALTDGVIFVLPFGASFIGWAATSWIITGHPFEQFSSIYGTSAQLKVIAQEGGQPRGMAAVHEAVTGLITLAPLLAIALLGALARARRDRDKSILGVLAVLGGTLVFEFTAFSLSMTLDSYRYLIYSIPFTFVLTGYAFRSRISTPNIANPRRPGSLSARSVTWRGRTVGIGARVALAVGALAVVLPGHFTAYHEMIFVPGRLSEEEKFQLAWIIAPQSRMGRQYGAEHIDANAISRQAAQFDSLHVAPGALMLDDAVGCIPQMILDSKHPTQFAIPNDINFVERMGAPYADGVRYMFVADPRGTSGALDSLDREWPSLYSTGAGLGTLVYQVTLQGCTSYRLYKLKPQQI